MSDNGAADPLRNPKDPLHNSGPQAGRELFRRMGQLASGFPNEAVIDASWNMLINAVRQRTATWQKAEPEFDQQFYQMKTLLRGHYDANGRRRNVFPFDQIVQMDRFHDKMGH